MHFDPWLSLTIYVIVVVICTSATTLYFQKALNREGKLYKAVAALTTGFLLYTVFEMFTSLFPNISDNVDYYTIPILLSDLAYLLIVASWVILLINLSDSPNIRNEKKTIVFVCIYGLIAESLGIFKWVGTGSQNVSMDLSMVALVFNLLFDFTIFAIGIYFIVFGKRRIILKEQRRLIMAMSGMLVIYMGYIAVWDYYADTGGKMNYTRYLDVDPLLFLYAVICIAIIYLAVRREPYSQKDYILYTIGITEDEAEKLNKAAEDFELTKRETEIVQLVMAGKSNPEISKELFISENTVKHHLNTIFRKAGVKTRYALIQKIAK